jgi:hypothetical protein
MAPPFLTLELDEGEWSAHAPAALPPRYASLYEVNSYEGMSCPAIHIFQL